MHEGRSVFARMRVDTRPFRHRDFRNLWIGQAISTIGGEIGTVAVPYQVYTLTHSTALVGLLGLASLIPLLVVPLIGGAIADALDRRTVLLRTETGMAFVAALFLGNSLLAHPRVWLLFVLQGLAVAIFSLGRPALSSLTPRLDLSYTPSACGDVNCTPIVTVDSYTLLNGRVTYWSPQRVWSLALQVTNLTDKLYYMTKAATGVGYIDGQIGAPREWALTLHKQF